MAERQPSTKLSPETFYDRQLRVPGWGGQGQERLGASTVLVVGVGGLGCPVLSYLSRSGVGRLVFADADCVEASNLPRQTLFGLEDVGRTKVEAATDALRRANPWITLEPLNVRVDPSLVCRLVEDVDLVIDGTDNFATKFLLHDACFTLGKPFVAASLYQWEAQVQVFDFRRDDPGCWRCLYPEAPQDGCVGVCADVGVAGALAGLAGSFQALAALRLLLNLDGPPARTSWVFDVADWSPRRLAWKINPNCPLCSHPRTWNWLGFSNRVKETSWDELDPEERQFIVDVREPFEIDASEWAFFQSQGSQVLGFPWSTWSSSQPRWRSDASYLIVCAAGVRSRAAATTAVLPVGTRIASLTGGVKGLVSNRF